MPNHPLCAYMHGMTTIEPPQWDFTDRMGKALRHANLRKEDVAADMKISPRTVRNWLTGATKPSKADLEAFARRCRVPYDWLKGDATSTKWSLFRALQIKAAG